MKNILKIINKQSSVVTYEVDFQKTSVEYRDERVRVLKVRHPVDEYEYRWE